jgi:hypothetical protein
MEKDLAETLTRVFAEMVFMDLLPADVEPDTADAAKKPMESMSIVALKPVSIRLEVSFSSGLKKKVIDTLFEGEDAKRADDTLLEMLNITAGGFLIAHFGQNAEIKLELPEYSYFDDAENEMLLVSVSFLAEGEPLFAKIKSVRYRY